MNDQIAVHQFGRLNVPIYGTHEDPLFKAKDIGDMLNLSNIRVTIKDFNEKQKVVSKAYTAGGLQDTLMLTERGLYKVLMTSRSKLAEQFQDWVSDVIKEIRLTGQYNQVQGEKQKLIEESKARM